MSCGTQEIARRVEAFFAFADRIESRFAQARAQVNQLTLGLLAPQDLNEEPMEKFLERILPHPKHRSR